MTKKFSIAVDAMGGDNAPEKVLEGINLLFERYFPSFLDFLRSKRVGKKKVP